MVGSDDEPQPTHEPTANMEMKQNKTKANSRQSLAMCDSIKIKVANLSEVPLRYVISFEWW